MAGLFGMWKSIVKNALKKLKKSVDIIKIIVLQYLYS